jgi:ArsR family transcriptional regulator
MTTATTPDADASEVFESAAELFGLLSTPVRLKLISALCHGERNVSDLLAQIETTQPNLSQHLGTLYRAGILGRRREGTQMFYRVVSDRAAMLCRAVCTQVAMEIDGSADMPVGERLLPGRRLR